MGASYLRSHWVDAKMHHNEMVTSQHMLLMRIGKYRRIAIPKLLMLFCNDNNYDDNANAQNS